jgi:transcriptional regulator with XRE-family HTH domain
MPRSADTPRARELGAALRRARDDMGMTQRALASAIGRRASSHIARWESGELSPSETDTATVLGVLRVTGSERDRLLELARAAADPNWIAPGVDKQLAALMEYERTAERITDVSPLLIPGLLQTGDYARAIMFGAGATRGEADHRVALRLSRRDVLTRAEPGEFVALIGEHALSSAPCTPKVMLEQLQHMLRSARTDHITIQMLTMDGQYSPALQGAFMLLEFASTRPVVHLEHYRSSATITDTKDARDFQAAVDTLRREAMSPGRTTELIAEITEKYEMECT